MSAFENNLTLEGQAHTPVGKWEVMMKLITSHKFKDNSYFTAKTYNEEKKEDVDA